MPLDEKQKTYLRGVAHGLKPVVYVGNAGVTAGVTAELDHSLDHHELIKVRLRVGDREARDAAIERVVAAASAELVGRIGNVAILYRRNVTKPVIALP